MGRRGAAKVAPERELGPSEIDDLGAYDIGEALARAGSALGLTDAPTIIVNGRRVVSPRDYLGFPPDALARIEVLPTEAAALYGGDPSRRVVNLVLQQSFQSVDAQLSAARPTQAGKSSVLGDLRRGSIVNNDTTQLGLRVTHDTSLRAGERRLDAGKDQDPLITLRPASDVVAGNLAVNRTLGTWTGSFSANARQQTERSVIRAVDGGTLGSDRRAETLTIIGGLIGQHQGWDLEAAATGMAGRARQRGVAISDSSNRSVVGTLTAQRRLLDLPAGPLTTTLAGRLGRARSDAGRGPGDRQSIVDRTADIRIDLSAPLSRNQPAGEGRGAGRLGDLTLSVSAAVQDASSTSGAAGSGASLTWSPARRFSFTGSWSTLSEGATAQQRFDPIYYAPRRVVFDFRTGQSVEVQPILGGNPDLRPQSTDQVTLVGSLGPFGPLRLVGSTSLQSTTSRDGVSILPMTTPAVEAAFPERFVRDVDGTLLSIDQRPINVERSLSELVISTLSFALPFGRAPTPGKPPGASVRIGLNHTWRRRDVVTLRPGLAPMNRLAGDGGGASRHEVALQLDVRRGAWLVNAGARWRAAYRVRETEGRDGDNDLRISGFGTVDLKLTYLVARPSAASARAAGADLSQARRGAPMRLSVEVENLFDARPGARLGDGQAAPGYGRDDQDPVGRVVRLMVSRRF